MTTMITARGNQRKAATHQHQNKRYRHRHHPSFPPFSRRSSSSSSSYFTTARPYDSTYFYKQTHSEDNPPAGSRHRVSCIMNNRSNMISNNNINYNNNEYLCMAFQCFSFHVDDYTRRRRGRKEEEQGCMQRILVNHDVKNL